MRNLVKTGLILFFIAANWSQAYAQCVDFIYVTPTGSGTGTKTSPTSLTNGVAIAQSGSVIKMATGTYGISNAINIPSGVTFEGGYQEINSWVKTSLAGATTIIRTSANPEGGPAASRLVAFYGNGVSNFRFQDITIVTANGTATAGAGMSTYAVHLTNCADYHFVRTQLLPGSGSAGASGSVGSISFPGAVGSIGGDGSCDGNFSGVFFGSETAPGGAGGAGGTGAIGISAGANGTGRNGGGGGAGGKGEGFSGVPLNALPGNNGGGSASAGLNTGVGLAGNTGNPGGDGTNGTSGINGANGTQGVNGAPGSHIGNFWVPGAVAGTGLDGAGGQGGAGGGGGGAQDCALCDNGPGNGGAGGGGGGQGGAGGLGGFGGGSSFGLYLVNNGGGGNIIQCNVTTGYPGAGGLGGAGRAGGAGGAGGPRNTRCFNEIGEGGAGGNGGAGGSGGAGGNGQAGLALAVFFVGGSPLANNELGFNLGSQAEISVTDINCSNRDVAFSSSVSQNWNLGSGANPVSVSGANVITQYSTIGRKDIVYDGAAYIGFTNIRLLAPIPSITTTAPLVMGNYTIPAGSSVSFSAGSSGQFYEWVIDDGSNANTYSGTGLQNLINVPFNDCGNYSISLTYNFGNCCALTSMDTATLLLQVISAEYPDFTFTGADVTNPDDPMDIDNWQGGCMPPFNDPNVNLTIMAGSTFKSSATFPGDIINYGALKGGLTLLGQLTNFGVISPGN